MVSISVFLIMVLHKMEPEMVHPIIFFVINLSEDKEKHKTVVPLQMTIKATMKKLNLILVAMNTNLWTKYYATRSVSTELRVWPLILKGNVNRGF